MEVASTPGATSDLYAAGCIDITGSPDTDSSNSSDSEDDNEGSDNEDNPRACKHCQASRHGFRQSFDPVETSRVGPAQKPALNPAPLDSLQLLPPPGQ